MKKNRILALVALLLAVSLAFFHGPVVGYVVATIAAAALMPINRLQLNAVGPLNLLDIAARNGESVHSLIEAVLTTAPELASFGMLPISGTTYETLTCTALPSGDFRKVGDGTTVQKSEWKREIGSMSLFEALMRVPQDVLVQARQRAKTLTDGDILASEAVRYVRGCAIKIGAQTWYGQKISTDGFAGISTQVVTASNQISAGTADGTDSSSAYLINLDADPVNPQGVHYVMGNEGQMSFADEWGSQQSETSSGSGKYFKIFTNNFLSYLGLVYPRLEAAYRIKGISAANPLTDALAAQLISKVPLAARSGFKNWRWFMNTTAQYTLQNYRITSAVSGNGTTFVPTPVDMAGIPIIVTDSLITTERAGLKP